MRREEIAAQVKEDTTQIRLTVGEKLGQMPPDVQVKMNQVLDACERIDRAVAHGVGPGEPPPGVAPGVPPDGLQRPGFTKGQAVEDPTREDRFATTEQVRGQRRPSATDAKTSRGEASPEARAATAKAAATKSVAAEGDRPKPGSKK